MSSPAASPVRRAARSWRRFQLRRECQRAGDPARANAALNAAEIRHGRTRLASTPLTIQLMTTLACNLRCPFCKREEPDYREHIDHLDETGRDLPWDVVERVLAVAPYALSVTLTPLGEPTLYRHWERLLDRAREMGLRNLDMTSNATRLPEALCEKIIRAGFQTIYFSIDSADPATFARMRLGTTLAKVEAGLERLNAWKQRLAATRPELRIAATFDRQNIEDLPGLVDFAARHGASELNVQKMEIYSGMDLRDDLVHHPEVTHRAIEEAQRRAAARGLVLRLHYALLNQLGAAASVGGAGDSSAAFHRPAEAASQLTDLCTHPWHFCVVDTNGDVRPCCWAAVKYGNLVETPDFDAVWNSEVAQQMRRDFLGGRLTPGCIDKHCGVSKRWEALEGQRTR